MNAKNLLPKDKHDASAMEQLQQLSDEEIEPLLPELLTWLQDLNWPIAADISKLIGKHADIAEPYVLQVLRGTDEAWKYNILSRLLYDWDGRLCGEGLMAEIRRIAIHPTAAEAEEEVSLAAAELLAFYTHTGLIQNRNAILVARRAYESA